MSLYTIPRKIKRIDIFRPKATLKTWLNKQTDKPDILFNASLYVSTSKPCGTIWEDGKNVSNEGKGFGFGTTNQKTVLFGGPWDRSWHDYITGYYGLIQNGVAIDPPWTDKYVFDCKLKRIAFGQLKNGSLAVFCEDSKDIKTFAKDGKAKGFTSLCNLDGGGSRALYWLGEWVHTSTRTPYNAVAIWLEPETTSTTTGGSNTMNVKCTKRTAVYDSLGRQQAGRYIDAGDICELYKELESKAIQVKIVYPSGSTKRTAYVKDLSAFKEV